MLCDARLLAWEGTVGVDAVELIVVALTAGAASGLKDTATSAVKDAYMALVDAARRRLGGGKDEKPTLVEEHAADPDEHRDDLVAALTAVRADHDPRLIAAAKKFLTTLGSGERRADQRVKIRNIDNAQFGDHNTINNNHNYGTHADPPVGLENGIAALQSKQYDVAVAQLGKALQVRPADADLHYYLALALLRGRRPHQVRSQAEISKVRHHLTTANSLAHARLLRVLVDEDCGRHWEHAPAVTSGLRRLADGTDLDHIAEIAEHASAPQNRVWELLKTIVEES